MVSPKGSRYAQAVLDEYRPATPASNADGGKFAAMEISPVGNANGTSIQRYDGYKIP